MSTPVEIAWFSALCDDDYAYLGVPEPALQSRWEHWHSSCSRFR